MYTNILNFSVICQILIHIFANQTDIPVEWIIITQQSFLVDTWFFNNNLESLWKELERLGKQNSTLSPPNGGY